MVQDTSMICINNLSIIIPQSRWLYYYFQNHCAIPNVLACSIFVLFCLVVYTHGTFQLQLIQNIR